MELSLGSLGLNADPGEEAALKPNDIPGLVLWLDSRLGVSVVGGNVAAWASQGSSGVWLQSNAARRPAYNLAGPIPFVQFDEANLEFLQANQLASSLFGTNPLSMFMVASVSGTPPDPLLGQPSTPRLWLQDASAVYRGPGGELSFGRNTSLAVRGLHHDGTDYFYRENGSELARATKALGSLAASQMVLGTDQGSTWLSGNIYAALFYSRAAALSLSEIQSIEQYLAAEFLP